MNTTQDSIDTTEPENTDLIFRRCLTRFNDAAKQIRRCDRETLSRACESIENLTAAHRTITQIEQYMDALESGEPAAPYADLEKGWNHNGQIAMRQELQRRRAYATLSKETLDCMLKHTEKRRIVDIGAGAGHLARVLTGNRRETIAIDAGESRGYVKKIGVNVIAGDGPQWMRHNANDNDAVLISWPPTECGDIDGMAQRTLNGLKPEQLLLFIGEDEGGCTGSVAFHKTMKKRRSKIASAAVAPLIGWGVHDRLSVWRQR